MAWADNISLVWERAEGPLKMMDLTFDVITGFHLGYGETLTAEPPRKLQHPVRSAAAEQR